MTTEGWVTKQSDETDWSPSLYHMLSVENNTLGLKWAKLA